MLLNPNKITYNEFLELDKNKEELLEFIDGEVYLQASPSTTHQRISRKEYWIISPKNNDIQIFNLDENGFYGEPSTFYGDSVAVSTIFDDLKVNLKDLFMI